MKKISIIITIVMISAGAVAQNPLLRGSSQLNAGVGLAEWGFPVYIGLDYGLQRDISVGAEASFIRYRENLMDVYYLHSITGISGNLNYHFNRIFNMSERWDLYGGANLGFYIWKSPVYYPGKNASGLNLGLQIGGRYYFTRNIAFNLEFGSGNAFSGGKGGLTFLF